jgi:N-acyl-D-aspartate/D-glutamate deacylase
MDCFLDLSLEEDLKARFVHINTQGDPKAVCEILKHPSVMIGQSDAGAHMGYDARFGYCTAFLGRWVRDHGIMSWAVHKLTFRVAPFLASAIAGLLRAGLADIAVFVGDRKHWAIYAVYPAMKRAIQNAPAFSHDRQQRGRDRNGAPTGLPEKCWGRQRGEE